jgi:hypothetical protein
MHISYQLIISLIIAIKIINYRRPFTTAVVAFVLLCCELTSHTDRMYGWCVPSIVAQINVTCVSTLQI